MSAGRRDHRAAPIAACRTSARTRGQEHHAVELSEGHGLLGRVSVYTPESSLGWLDFDATASERVATLLRSLQEPSTLDVLGLGTIRDAFADMLSPGVSTVQTRLRYFIFVPWIFQRLEAEPVPPARFARKLREAETRLIDCLRKGGDDGVIGSRARRSLKRMPSEIYWGGLGAWGVRRLDMSIAEYGQWASAPRPRPERDNDGNATTRDVTMWAASIPQPSEPFLDNETDGETDFKIDFNLSADEALFLTERIQQSRPGSLLAELSAKPEASIDADYPWELDSGSLSGRLTEVLRHARCFSELMLGPQLVYNVLLSRRAEKELGWDKKKLREGQSRLLDEWADGVSGQRDALGSWAGDLRDFWDFLAGWRIGTATQNFVNDLARRAVADPEGFARDSSVHELIANREWRLKTNRARLVNRSALENWNGAAVGGQFDYRWPTTKRYLNDLAAAMPPAGSTPRPVPTAERPGQGTG